LARHFTTCLSSAIYFSNMLLKVGRWRQLLCLLYLFVPLSHALEPAHFTVRLTAVVELSPPGILLRWPHDPEVVNYRVWRKVNGASTWGAALAELPGDATQFLDRSVTLGSAFEYQVEALTSHWPYPAGNQADWKYAHGYIYAGINLPLVEQRGKIVLLVEQSLLSALPSELARLEQDLIGDGWMVIRESVSAQEKTASVRNLIKGHYESDPVQVKAVFLLGRLPVPYSGDLMPDLHPTHRGAWPADVYYGQMSGSWTDHSVHLTGSFDPRHDNLPGDGKLDQSVIPAPVELTVGRVDLSAMPAFLPLTEVDLLRQYLNKNHNFRHKRFDLPRRALIRDAFGVLDGDAPAASALRNFAPLVGVNEIREAQASEYFSTLEANGYLWSYGGGGGSFQHADGMGSTSDFAVHDPRCVFYMLHGSFFGDWDTRDNFLRAPLGSRSFGLASAWVGLPHWFFHHMALGETIGYSTRLTQNNTGTLYRSQVNDSRGGVHIALMGDPTLRLHPVGPPSNLRAVSGHGVRLDWNHSSDDVIGYSVYRASSPAGPFSRLNRLFLAEPNLTDAWVAPGRHTYMVRAIRLEETPSGTYYNGSQGIFITVEVEANPTLPIITVEASQPQAAEAGVVPGVFTIAADGAVSTPLTVHFSFSGAATPGEDYQHSGNSVVLQPGTSSAEVQVLPIPDEFIEGEETVILTLVSNPAYQIGTPSSASVSILDNTPPRISSIAAQSAGLDQLPLEIPFTIADDETSAGDLQLQVFTSTPEVLPENSLQLSGEGEQRLLRVLAGEARIGSTTIQIEVNDGFFTASASFELVLLAPLEWVALRNGPAGVELQFRGLPGRIFTLEFSEDLRAWERLDILTVSPRGELHYLHQSGTGLPRGFYRLTPE
jgi:hypothetical protein